MQVLEMEPHETETFITSNGRQVSVGGAHSNSVTGKLKDKQSSCEYLSDVCSSRWSRWFVGFAVIVGFLLVANSGSAKDVDSEEIHQNIHKNNGSSGIIGANEPPPTPKAKPSKPSKKVKPTAKPTEKPIGEEDTEKPTAKPTQKPTAKADTESGSNEDSNEASKDVAPEEQKERPAFVYAKMATIMPDPFHAEITEETKTQLADKWGKWHFWDGDESERPTSDYCAAFPNCDIPGEEFPEEAWQADAVYVNHLVDDGENLASRAMEAIYTEYGHGKPLDASGLADRLKQFHWEKVSDMATATGPPEHYDLNQGSEGGGGGGWTTSRSHEGLIRRLLHAFQTNDDFTVVMAGDGAAAGAGNHFQQSYLAEFYKVVSPVLARFGVKLIARNLAQEGLGTLHTALGAADLFGNEIDLLIWDASSTDTAIEHIDLFLRQGILGSQRVPHVWVSNWERAADNDFFDMLKQLHEEGDVDFGVLGTAMDGIDPITSEDDLEKSPWASKGLKCDENNKELCQNELQFCAKCWIDRSDIQTPKDLFPELEEQPTEQQKLGNPGWREHRLKGRLLAFSLLGAIQAAIQQWSDGTMGGPPLDDEYWHMTDYYKNIRDKLTNIDANVGYCHKMSEVLPARVCNTPLQARTFHTPRANPDHTSLSNLIRPADDGYKPTRITKMTYEGADVHNTCYDIPEDEIDVEAIVMGRRRARNRKRKLSQVVDRTGTTTLPFIQHRNDTGKVTSKGNHVSSSSSLSALLSIPQRKLNDKIVPGKGWQVMKEPPGQCDGEYHSICGRAADSKCPLYGHHDGRGLLAGDEWSGWLVMDIPSIQHGIIILGIRPDLGPGYNTRTKDWTTVNDERKIRHRRRLKNNDQHQPIQNTAAAAMARTTQAVGQDFGPSFQFEYAIDGEITTLNAQDFGDKVKDVQSNMQVLTLLDDSAFAGSPTTELAIRVRGCGRECTLGITHVYWA